MAEIIVKDLMVPLDEYATVSCDATLYDAVFALENALEDLDRERYHYLHRGILVLDNNRDVVGKISHLDVLWALEPMYKQMGDPGAVALSGFSPEFLKSMLEQYSLYRDPLIDLCRKGSKQKVKDFMYTPSEGEYVDENALLAEAMHQLVMGRHQSLLVMGKDKIIGVLRLSDVFKEIFQTIKTCTI